MHEARLVAQDIVFFVRTFWMIDGGVTFAMFLSFVYFVKVWRNASQNPPTDPPRSISQSHKIVMALVYGLILVEAAISLPTNFQGRYSIDAQATLMALLASTLVQTSTLFYLHCRELRAIPTTPRQTFADIAGRFFIALIILQGEAFTIVYWLGLLTLGGHYGERFMHIVLYSVASPSILASAILNTLAILTLRPVKLSGRNSTER